MLWSVCGRFSNNLCVHPSVQFDNFAHLCGFNNTDECEMSLDKSQATDVEYAKFCDNSEALF